MPFGHVAVVKAIIPGGIQVAEENWLGNSITDIRNVTGSSLNGIQGFILPPGGANVSNALAGGAIGGAIGSGAVGNAVNTALDLPTAISNLPTQIGNGLANATSATAHDIGVFFKNNIVGLVVALVVALVLFGGDESRQ